MLRKILLDDAWRFHEGDIDVGESPFKTAMYLGAKTERKLEGPAARNYPDDPDRQGPDGRLTMEKWTAVDLPHDYIIGQEPSEENNSGLGYFKYNNAWYRKHFTLPELKNEARVRLYFEGVAIHSKIYVNGCYMRTNNCGYSSFEVDMTDVAEFGGENTVAVYIDTSEHEGWWYEGAGIYRHVWLEIADPVSIDRYGVFIHPEKREDGTWRVPVDTELRNDGFTDETVTVIQRIRDPEGHEVLCLEDSLEVPLRSHAVLRQSGEVTSPALWDIDDPELYTLVTEIRVNGEKADELTDRFGFRTFVFDPANGFFLNGRHRKIQGVCCHQDYGLTGKAVPERVQRYKLELLKQMGANGYRCSHYPHPDYTMRVLDELGFLVLAETRWYESTPEGMEQLDMLVKRDRNRPSVIFWSAGNEEPLHTTAAGRRTAKSLLYRMRALDGTRPVTTAISHSPEKSPLLDTVDIIGVNYNIESWDAIHKLHPDTPFVSTECCATGTTRGWYMPNDPKRGYIYGYDRDTNSMFLGREKTWKTLMERPWAAGGYQWDGVEHRGETAWPRLCSQSGAIDLFLQKKDAFYQNKSHWTREPMVHILPHWNLPERLGEEVRVSVYTNCEAVELIKNGMSLGVKQVEPFGHAEWQVVYEPGKLEAIGYRKEIPVCRDAQETTGPAKALRLTSESAGVRADGKDVVILTCDCVDDAGRHVPDADPVVEFMTNEFGRVEGTGSDVSDHVPVTSPIRKMRAGLISVLVRAGNRPGKLCVYAKADGLTPVRLEIELQ